MTHAEIPDDRGPHTRAEPDSRADAEDAPERTDEEQAAQRWVEDLVERGEAVPEGEGEDTDLPPGATHEVVEGDDGPTRVRRRRFPIT